MITHYLKFLVLLVAFNVLVQAQSSSNNVTQDRFTYRDTDWNNRQFGPKEWGAVNCDNVATCPGWPTNWDSYNSFIPYHNSSNVCLDCAENTSGKCGNHKQSPIHLLRNVTAQRTCIDRHQMHHSKGNCRLEQMKFQIQPHALQAIQPVCQLTPDIDFSRGFTIRWKLDFTEITVPSQHTIDGQQYDAEVVLSHTYEENVDDRYIANVAVLLQAGSESDKYDFLELYLDQWQQQRQKIEQQCLQVGLLEPNTTNPSSISTPIKQSTTMPTTTLSQYPQMLKTPVFQRRWNPYDWLDKVGTEYYFRYEGSTVVPPCFRTVHWRVLKDVIKIAPSQLLQLQQLIAYRLDPITCRYDTIGKPRDNDWRVNVNRPIQTTTDNHKLVFCECVNWKSKTVNDNKYCKLSMPDRGVYNNTLG